MATLVRIKGTHSYTRNLDGPPKMLVERYIVHGLPAATLPDAVVASLAGTGNPDPALGTITGFNNIGDPHWAHEDIICERIEADYVPDSTSDVEIFVYFRSPMGTISAPPLTEPRIRISLGNSTIPWTMDLDGDYIGNPSYTAVEVEQAGAPATWVSVADPELHLNSNAELGSDVLNPELGVSIDMPPGSFAPAVSASFVGTVNSTLYLGFAPGVLQYLGYDADEAAPSTAGARRFNVTHNFRAGFRKVTWETTPGGPLTTIVVPIEFHVWWDFKLKVYLSGRHQPERLFPPHLARVYERADFNQFLPDPEP